MASERDKAHFRAIAEAEAELNREALHADALLARGMKLGKAVGPAEAGDALPDMQVCWSRHSPAVRVDVFIAKTGFEAAALSTARRAQVFGAEIRVISPEASIIYKLLASR